MRSTSRTGEGVFLGIVLGVVGAVAGGSLICGPSCSPEPQTMIQRYRDVLAGRRVDNAGRSRSELAPVGQRQPRSAKSTVQL
jgi:hypothetical protein